MKTHFFSIYKIAKQCVTLLLLLLLPNQFLLAASSFELETTNVVRETAAQISNKDVLEMTKMGFGSEIIIAKIKSSVCSFDTSPTALNELKKSGVSDSVILAMVQFKPASSAISSVVAAPQTAVRTNNSAFPIVGSKKMLDIKVPDGTPLEIELTDTVSSDEAQKDSVMNFRVLRSVQVNGVTVIERGTSVTARVQKVTGGDKKLECIIQDTIAVDGTRVPLEFERKAKNDKKESAATRDAEASVLVFPTAGSSWGSKKDKAAKIPAGQRYGVFTRGDITINSKKTAAEIASLNSGIIDLNGMWSYAGQLVQITQQGQNVIVNYLAGQASCNGTMTKYVFQGQLEGTKLVGKMPTCTQPQFVTSCRMLPVNELSFSAEASYGKIVGTALVPNLSMMLGINGTCSLMHDPRLDQNFAITITRVATSE